MNIFLSQDYREIIKRRLEDKKKLDKSISYRTMAEHMLIQKPYLSRVLNGYADFNTDQLYMACQYLQMNEEEYHYMGLLLEYDRSGHAKRKEELLRQIKNIQFLQNDTGQKVKGAHQMSTQEFDASDLVNFFLDPLNYIVHAFLSIPKYRKEPEKIGQALGISQENLSRVLIELEKLKLIEAKEGAIKVLVPTVHLPRDSRIVVPHQKLMTQISAHHKGDIPFSDKKAFYITFASNAATKAKIESEFNSFIERVGEIVTKDKKTKTDCYQLNFDFFPWS